MIHPAQAAKTKSRFFQLAALTVLAAVPGLAANFSFTGNFGMDDDLATFTFQLNAPSTVTLVTLGYAGGTNSAGQTILPGGFDPFISIFQGLGPTSTLFNVNNDGGCGSVGQDGVTNACFDAFLQLVTLPSGDYTVVLTQSDNSPFGPTLGDGFSQSGNGNFTGPTFLGVPGSFIDATGAQRTSAWALDIRGVDSLGNSAGVPEPASMVLFGSGCLALFVTRRQRHN